MESQVTIIGAGPAGALLAYLLASRGVETLLVERQEDFEREFRGEVLMPSGVRALAAAGFDLDAIATSVPDRAQAYINGQCFLDVETEDLEPPLPTAVSQPELLEALGRRALATGRCELRRGTTVRRIERGTDGRSTLEVRDADGRWRSLETSYVIGADGRGSISRRTLAPRVQSRGAPLDVVWFKLPYPEAWEEARGRFEMGRGHLLIAMRSAEGLLQTAWVIVKGTYGELKSRSVPEWIDEMSRHADPELAAHLTRHRDAATRPFLLNAVADRVVGWAAPGMLLIGDAAHTMSPVGGQGINLALRDALVTANELVPPLTRGGDVDAAAARVEDLRAPEIDRIQRLAAIPPRIMMGRTPLHELLRRGLAKLASTAFGRARAGAGASLFLDGVTEVELRV